VCAPCGTTLKSFLPRSCLPVRAHARQTQTVIQGGGPKVTSWPVAANAVLFVAASSLAVGPDAWLEWLSWVWTAGFAVAVRMSLIAAAVMAMGALVRIILHQR
jgi:hypothetical protein